MNQPIIYPAQMDTQSFGYLRVRATTQDVLPIENATVNILSPSQPETIIEQVTTDSTGLTGNIPLPAPPTQYSLEPSLVQPYSNYDVEVIAPGYESTYFADVEILPNVTAVQETTLNLVPEPSQNVFVISPHTLFATYPPKIPEEEIKSTSETGEIVLSRVVIPEFVIVHDGPPTSSANNYYIRFPDYIKNVASSEIYATWPESTIYANVLAILSFTLNRIYTEWYRNQGFNFTITSSTAFDHKWINGRNIYDNISWIVDSVFVNYLSRPNVRQPILTQYCDGNRVQCPDWMSQWGSKNLGDQNYSAIQILRNYYGSNMYINTAVQVSGVPSSWPGYNLGIGASGDNVRIIQSQLNAISEAYPQMPRIAVDGIYGPRSSEAVRTFQKIFGLPQTGVVDLATWYKISRIYVGVTRIGV